jgi:hypothetical protein
LDEDADENVTKFTNVIAGGYGQTETYARDRSLLNAIRACTELAEQIHSDLGYIKEPITYDCGHL